MDSTRPHGTFCFPIVSEVRLHERAPSSDPDGSLLAFFSTDYIWSGQITFYETEKSNLTTGQVYV